MNTLAVIFVLFVLGALALYFLEVAKNIAFILFVLILGWGMFHFIGPYVIGENQTIGESLLVWNEKYKEHATNNLEQGLDNPGFTFEDLIAKNFETLLQERKSGWRQWENESVMGGEKIEVLHGSARDPEIKSMFVEFVFDNLKYTVLKFIEE